MPEWARTLKRALVVTVGASVLACQDPTGVLGETACTLVAHYPSVDGVPAYDVKACYRTCPDSAQAWAASHNEQLVQGWRCV